MNNPVITIREALIEDAVDIASVHVKAWQESYKNIIAQDYLDNISFTEKLELRKKILSNKSHAEIHLVAVYDGKIAGFCSGGPSRNDLEEGMGEIYAIYLLDEFKSRGIGGQLWHQAYTHLVLQGLTPFITWVLEGNKTARLFYEKKGGQVLREQETKIGEQIYRKIAYVFN